MRIFGLLCCLAFVTLVPARSTTELRTDGAWWRDLTESGRLTAVEAAEDAYLFGFVAGSGSEAAYYVAHPKASENDGFAWERKTAPVFSKTFGAYTAAITDFYERKNNSVSIGRLMNCLQDAFGDCDKLP